MAILLYFYLTINIDNLLGSDPPTTSTRTPPQQPPPNRAKARPKRPGPRTSKKNISNWGTNIEKVTIIYQMPDWYSGKYAFMYVLGPRYKFLKVVFFVLNWLNLSILANG